MNMNDSAWTGMWCCELLIFNTWLIWFRFNEFANWINRQECERNVCTDPTAAVKWDLIFFVSGKMITITRRLLIGMRHTFHLLCCGHQDWTSESVRNENNTQCVWLNVACSHIIRKLFTTTYERGFYLLIFFFCCRFVFLCAKRMPNGIYSHGPLSCVEAATAATPWNFIFIDGALFSRVL